MFNLQSGHIREATNEGINKWNNKSTFSLPLSIKTNKHLKNILFLKFKAIKFTAFIFSYPADYITFNWYAYYQFSSLTGHPAEHIFDFANLFNKLPRVCGIQNKHLAEANPLLIHSLSAFPDLGQPVFSRPLTPQSEPSHSSSPLHSCPVLPPPSLGFFLLPSSSPHILVQPSRVHSQKAAHGSYNPQFLPSWLFGNSVHSPY